MFIIGLKAPVRTAWKYPSITCTACAHLLVLLQHIFILLGSRGEKMVAAAHCLTFPTHVS